MSGYIRQPFRSRWDFAVRGWRPIMCWICVVVLVVNGVVLPMAQLWGAQVQPLDWSALAVFAGTLGIAGVQRSTEKIYGVTS